MRPPKHDLYFQRPKSPLLKTFMAPMRSLSLAVPWKRYIWNAQGTVSNCSATMRICKWRTKISSNSSWTQQTSKLMLGNFVAKQKTSDLSRSSQWQLMALNITNNIKLSHVISKTYVCAWVRQTVQFHRRHNTVVTNPLFFFPSWTPVSSRRSRFLFKAPAPSRAEVLWIPTKMRHMWARERWLQISRQLWSGTPERRCVAFQLKKKAGFQNSPFRDRNTGRSADSTSLEIFGTGT